MEGIVYLVVFVAILWAVMTVAGKAKRAVMPGKVAAADELTTHGLGFTAPLPRQAFLAELTRSMGLHGGAPMVGEKRYLGEYKGIPAIICGTKLENLHSYSLQLVDVESGVRGFLDLIQWQTENWSELMSHSAQTRATRTLFQDAIVGMGGTVRVLPSAEEEAFLHGGA